MRHYSEECVLDMGCGRAAIPTDAKQLRRVLDHLLRNAAAWTMHGSVLLSISHVKVGRCRLTPGFRS